METHLRTPPFDFSQNLRDVIHAGIERKRLCEIAHISPATLYRWENPHSRGDQPGVVELREWNKAIDRLPQWFRKACESVIGPTPSTSPDLRLLDADGDHKVTVKDLNLFNAKKQMIAAQLSVHRASAGADEKITPNEAAEDARLCREEIALADQSHKVMQYLATG